MLQQLRSGAIKALVLDSTFTDYISSKQWAAAGRMHATVSDALLLAGMQPERASWLA
jgi:hypothetical protein